MQSISVYPDAETVESADRYTLAKWFRFLVSPRNDNEVALMNRICDRFQAMGGWTPELSKQIGW